MSLDPTSFPEWRERLQRAEARGEAQPQPARRYPGYPTVTLPPFQARWWPPSLDDVLRRRRSEVPGTALPCREVLGTLLALAHGITGVEGRGSVPSAGGFQALELYVGVLSTGWLTEGVWHYGRATHSLARCSETTPQELHQLAPSLALAQGGALCWIVVADVARVWPKYGERGRHFLTLEAGHLMQNLCLVSVSLGLVTLPLGGYFEAGLARALHLLPTDEVLYLGACGAALSQRK